MKIALAAFASVLALSAAPAHAASAGAQADAAFAATTLNLSAYGETRAAPDMATLTLGVTAQAPSAREAMRKNAASMTSTLAALAAQGIAGRDVQTSGLSLSAQYAYDQGQPPRLTGYEASNQVIAVARDVTRVGAVADAAVGAGANRLEGISFGLRDPLAAENEARRAAVAALAAKAALYAQATGYRVLRLVTLSEGGGFEPAPPRPMFRMAPAMAEAAPSTPVAPGELKVRVDISGVYELGR